MAVVDRAFEQLRAARFSGSVSKKPSCSTLLSSSPIGLPWPVKALRSTRFDAFAALEAHVPELVAEQHERRRPGLHPVERLRREAALLDRRGERRRASPAARARRAAAGPWREAEAGQRRHQLGRVLVVDDGLDHQLLRLVDRLVELGRAPLIVLGQQVDRPEQIDGRVGVGDRPQRGLRRLRRARWRRRGAEREQRSDGDANRRWKSLSSSTSNLWATVSGSSLRVR